MIRELVVEPRAQAEVAAALEWWEANRSKAPGALLDELERTFTHILAFPISGQVVCGRGQENVYRYPIKRVRYLVYYRIEPGRVLVASLWHASRQPPEL